MGHAAEASQVDVPPVVLRLQFVEFHVFHELFEPLFALRAANHLAMPGTRTSMAVTVFASSFSRM